MPKKHLLYENKLQTRTMHPIISLSRQVEKCLTHYVPQKIENPIK